MATLPVDPLDDVAGVQLVNSLKTAVNEGNVNRVKELINILKRRDEETESCTLDWDTGYFLLRDALQKDPEIAEILLDYGVQINRKSNQACNTPLHLAVKNRNFEMVEKLLNKGAKTRAKTSHGRTPLYLAAELNHEKIFKLLLEKDLEPAIDPKNKLQPIEAAVMHGHDNIFNILVSRGAKADLRYGNGKSMLHIAVEKGYYGTVRKIIKQKTFDVSDPLNNQLLTSAVMHYGRDYSDIVKILIDSKFEIDPEKVNDAEFIHVAAKKGYCAIVDNLLAMGANPNILDSEGYSLLLRACQSQKANVVKTLLKNNVDFTVKDSMQRSVLHYIIKNLHLSSYRVCSHINLFDRSGEDCDIAKKMLDDKCTCYSNEWFEILITLLNLGIDVKMKDGRNSTALHYVAEEYHYTNSYFHYIRVLTTLLIEAGADVRACDNEGNTPLQISISRERLEMIELLLPNANISDSCYVNLKKQTLIHSAAQSQTSKVLKMLLERQEFENVNIQDINGVTPLLLAVQRLSQSNVEILLQHGADVNLADKNMTTPLHRVVRLSGLLPGLEILLKYGANVNCFDKEGKTPLLLAALNEDDRSIKMLLKYGADLDTKIDKLGRTALHFCASQADESISKLLMFGANINVLDNYKATALDYLMKSMIAHCEKNEVSISDERQALLMVNIYTKIYRKNAYLYIEHILKLQAINSFVCEENLRAMHKYDDEYDWINDSDCEGENSRDRIPKIDDIRKRCQAEVNLMKQSTFENTNVSVYQILTKCRYRIAKYVLKNNNVLQQLKAPIFIHKFPIYCNFLILRIENCLEKKEILEQDTDYSFHYIFPSLPFNCVDEILSYLSNNDLKILISVCQLLAIDWQNLQNQANESTAVVATHVAKKQKI